MSNNKKKSSNKSIEFDALEKNSIVMRKTSLTKLFYKDINT